MAGTSRRRRWPWIAGSLAAAVTVAAFLPPVQARGKALGVLAEAVGIGFPRPFASDIRRADVTLGGVTGHLYSPEDPAPPILLIPGAAPLGKDDPRAVRLARSLARAGRTVFIPELTLYERRLVVEDLDAIVKATIALGKHESAEGQTLLLGISYGGSFALVAAADERLRGHLAQVATFGAYLGPGRGHPGRDHRDLARGRGSDPLAGPPDGQIHPRGSRGSARAGRHPPPSPRGSRLR